MRLSGGAHRAFRMKAWRDVPHFWESDARASDTVDWERECPILPTEDCPHSWSDIGVLREGESRKYNYCHLCGLMQVRPESAFAPVCRSPGCAVMVTYASDRCSYHEMLEGAVGKRGGRADATIPSIDNETGRQWDGFHVAGDELSYQADDYSAWDKVADLWLIDPEAAQVALRERLESPQERRQREADREWHRRRHERRLPALTRRFLQRIAEKDRVGRSVEHLMGQVVQMAILSHGLTAAAVAHQNKSWVPTIRTLFHETAPAIPPRKQESRWKGKRGKWEPILQFLRENGGGTVPVPEGIHHLAFANRLRCTLSHSRFTMEWRWSVRSNPRICEVISLGLWSVIEGPSLSTLSEAAA